MGQVIFDLEEMLKKRARESSGTDAAAELTAAAERIKAQVHAAVQAARVPLAEERGRREGRRQERTKWGFRMAIACIAWLAITTVAFVAGLVAGAL
jgi:hypothetical protein